MSFKKFTSTAIGILLDFQANQKAKGRLAAVFISVANAGLVDELF